MRKGESDKHNHATGRKPIPQHTHPRKHTTNDYTRTDILIPCNKGFGLLKKTLQPQDDENASNKT